MNEDDKSLEVPREILVTKEGVSVQVKGKCNIRLIALVNDQRVKIELYLHVNNLVKEVYA